MYIAAITNKITNRAIRLDSWRDASTLNIIYNDANYNEEEVQTYLKSIVEFMLAFKL